MHWLMISVSDNNNNLSSPESNKGTVKLVEVKLGECVTLVISMPS